MNSSIVTLKNKIVDKKFVKRIDKNGIFICSKTQSKDIKLSYKKWDDLYEKNLKEKQYLDNLKNVEENYLDFLTKELRETSKLNKNSVYLEIGCGEFILGSLLAKKFKCVVGIDFSYSALLVAKKVLDACNVKNYILIQGDILNLPINSGQIDLIFGGGVIEHFRDTERCLAELYRVLHKGGVSYNTVPYLSLGSLTYRQLWGNIPNIPVIKQLYEFLHIKLLGGKHMKYGYEMSFMASTLINLHKKVGFIKVKVDQFKVQLVFEFLPSLLRPPFIKLASTNRLFWPMVKVLAQK